MKNGHDSKSPPARSLAVTLIAYYSLSAFLIVLLATGYLYWGMVRNLDLEDDRLLADRVRLLHALLLRDPLDIAALRQKVDEVWQGGQRTQLFIRILDAQGQVVCVSKEMDEVLPASAFSSLAGNSTTGSNVVSKSGQLHRAMSVNLKGQNGQPAQWTVQVGMNRNEEVEILDDYRENLFFVLAVSFVFCTFAGYQITQRGIGPLRNITRVVSNTQPANLSERIDSTGLPKELQSLVDTFNEMMDRLERAFNRLSSFTADIAHELRTPVNNMRGELDVALGKPRSAEEYVEVIGSSLEELGRLSRTIESLLFLARAENPQTQIDREPVNLQEAIATICEFFEATAEDSGVTLKQEVEPNLKANLNRPLLQQAVGNLITNAIAHSRRGGTVEILAMGIDSRVDIEVADSGCGIAAEHLPHLFERFYRAYDSTDHRRPGMGLGLSIVKSIVELHGGRIEIASEIAKGTRVRISLPVATSKMTRS